MPENEEALLRLKQAHTFMDIGDYKKAIKKFELAIKSSGDDFNKTNAFMNIGICYSKLGDYGEARIYFNGAIKLKPDFAPALLNRGHMHYLAGDLESALADYDKAVEVCPEHSAAWNGKGMCFAEQGSLDDALVCFKKASDIAQKDAGYLGNVGKTYLLLEKPSEAIKYFIRQAEAEPSLSEPHVNIAQCYRVLGKLTLAVGSAEVAVRIEPDNADAYEELGLLMYESKQYAYAVVDFAKAFKISKKQELVEHLCSAILESGCFDELRDDCSLVQNGIISADVFVEKVEQILSAKKLI